MTSSPTHPQTPQASGIDELGRGRRIGILMTAAIASTSRQIGSTLGVAVTGAIVTSRLHGSVRAGFPAATHPAWWLLAGCGAVVTGLGVLATSRWALGTAERTAEALNPEVLGRRAQ